MDIVHLGYMCGRCGILHICLKRVLLGGMVADGSTGMDSSDINLPGATPDKTGVEMKNGEKPCHVYFIKSVNIGSDHRKFQNSRKL